MHKISPKDKFKLFHDYWSPKIVSELNDSYIKFAKFKGEFVMHQHDNEDELFYVIEGVLRIEFEDDDPVVLEAGEMIVIPKGMKHKPIADNEAHIMLIEPKSTLNTGDTINQLTKEKLDWI